MQPAEWQRVSDLFDDLVERRAGDRERRIAQAALPPALMHELRAMLEASDAAGDFLESPPTMALDARSEETGYRSLAVGSRIGAFEIDDLVGRGGQGEVYRAVRADGHYHQVVALKLLRPEAIRHAERFRAERQILAGLDHPAIGRLIDGGTTPDGRPYLAMEFVTGRPITEHCEAEGVDLEERIRLVREVADAVAHAHRHLVIHRDLKPGNVLVTEEGAVKLLDFGIARILADEDGMNFTEAILTPDYAAPEQFEGRNVTTATDVYALGALLFELVTGAPPWGTGGPFAGAGRLLGEEPPRASRSLARQAAPFVRASDLDGDLDAIIAKAMRTRPEDRYESAAAFGADLERHLTLRPVEARADDGPYRVRRFLQRNRGRVAAGLVTTATIAAGLLAWSAQARRTRTERAIAREENARARAVRDYLMLTLRTASREGGPSFRTAKQILDRTAAEFGRQIAEDGGEETIRSNLAVLHVLGELYVEMDDFETAAPLLEQEAELARRLGDAPAFARACQNLAVVAIRRGRLDEAENDLDTAARIWRRDPLLFAREIAEGAGIRAGLLRERGQRPEGIRLLESTLSRTRALLGPGSHEEAALLHNLGVHQVEMNLLAEAEDAFAGTFRLLARQGRTRSTLGILAANHRAGLAFRQGRHEEAEAMWREAIAARRDLYGPSAALAFTQLNLARLLIIHSRHAEALPILEEASEMSLAFAGSDSAITILLQQSFALALGLAERRAEADDMLAAAMRAGEAAFGPDHLYQALGYATRTQLRLFAGDFDGADADLASARAIVDMAGPEAAPHRADLDLLGAMVAEARTGAS